MGHDFIKVDGYESAEENFRLVDLIRFETSTGDTGEKEEKTGPVCGESKLQNIDGDVLDDVKRAEHLD